MRKPAILTLATWAIACTFPLLAGCQSLHDHYNGMHEHVHGMHEHMFGHLGHREPPPTEASILVGGDVHQPGKQKVSERGLTLSQAVALAGGPRRLESVPGAATNDAGPVRNQLTSLREAANRFSQAADALLERPSEGNASAVNIAYEGLDVAQNELQLGLAELLSSDAAGIQMKPVGEALSDIAVQRARFQATRAAPEHTLLKQSLQKYLELLSPIESQLTALSTRISVNPILAGRDVVLVSLAREDEPRLTIYFPYESVNTGPAATIALRSGDFVKVVPLQETTLRNPFSRQGDAFSVAGMIQRPGLAPSDQLRTLASVANANPLPDVDPAQMSVIVTRATADGLGRDVFILPYNQAIRPPFNSLPTMPLDIYEFTPTIRAPLILESVVSSIVNQSVTKRLVKKIPTDGPFRGQLRHRQPPREVTSANPGSLKL